MGSGKNAFFFVVGILSRAKLAVDGEKREVEGFNEHKQVGAALEKNAVGWINKLADG